MYLLLTIGLMISLLGCGTISSTKEAPSQTAIPVSTVTTPLPTPAPAEKKWVQVKSWSGSAMKTTENFTITGSEWRINWTCDPEDGSISVFQIFPRNKDKTQLEIAANKMGKGSDTNYRHEGAGTYNLVIGSEGAKWTVNVEEQQ